MSYRDRYYNAIRAAGVEDAALAERILEALIEIAQALNPSCASNIGLDEEQ